MFPYRLLAMDCLPSLCKYWPSVTLAGTLGAPKGAGTDLLHLCMNSGSISMDLAVISNLCKTLHLDINRYQRYL